jgi:hypothetical protein
VDQGGSYRCPHCGSVVQVPGAEASTEFHWENRNQVGFFRGFWESVKLSMVEPQRFFGSVPAGGDYVNPLLYGMICICIGFIFSAFYQVLFQSFGVFLGLLTHQPPREIAFGFGASVAIAAAIVVSSPVAAFIHLFLYTAVYHLFLWILGGNRKGFEATFRAFAYSQGPQLLQIIPFLGSLATFIWHIVLFIIGLKKLHQASTGQAVATVFLPLVLLCGLTFLLIAGIVALAVFVVAAAHHRGAAF